LYPNKKGKLMNTAEKKEFNRLKACIAEQRVEIAELAEQMYTVEEYEESVKESYDHGYQEAVNDCEEFFESRMRNLTDHIQKLMLTSTQLR